MGKKAKVIVYGCQMNAAEGERMQDSLGSLGYERAEDLSDADLIIIHTCCVREAAEEKIYGKIGEIKHLKKERPDLLLGVTGCMAQKEGEGLFRRTPHIDFILGPDSLGELNRVVKDAVATPGRIIENALGRGQSLQKLALPEGKKLSAWIPVMYGCDNFCSYCIVPYVRGRERSRPPEEILAETKRAVAGGCQEINLLGQNVNSYGKDLGKGDFADLLKMIDEVPGVKRVRFMTSHPKDLSDKLIRVMAAGEHICRHLHLPVQYGSNRILKAMNRGYSVEYYRDLTGRIREAMPDISLTTDLIVGFPGEEEKDFLETLAFVEEMAYDSAYTFMYSKRSGTPAATMAGQVPEEVKKDRLQRLMGRQNTISRRLNERLTGEALEVMVEGPSKQDSAVWTGRSSANKILLWPHGEERPGDFVQVKVTQPQTWVLKGEILP